MELERMTSDLNVRSRMTSIIVPEVLGPYNYEDWRIWMESYFRSKDLWDVVFEHIDIEGLSQPHPNSDTNDKTLRMKNAEALYAILISCGSPLVKEIKKFSRAYDAWDYLAKKFGPRESEPEIEIDWTRWKREIVGAFPWIVQETEAIDDVCNLEALERFHLSGSKLTPYINGFNSAKTAWKQLVAMHEHPRGIWITSHTWCPSFSRALWEGNREEVKKFLDEYPDVVGVRITPEWDTPFHITAKAGHDKIMEHLVNRLEDTNAAMEIIKRTNLVGETAISIIATGGSTKLAQSIFKKYPDLFFMRNLDELFPITMAAVSGNKKMVYHLYQQHCQGGEFIGLTEQRMDEVVTLLNALIAADIFDLALDLLRRYPESSVILDHRRDTVLNALAKKPSAFPSGLKLDTLGCFIFKYINEKPIDREGTTENPHEGCTTPDACYQIPIPTDVCYACEAKFGVLQRLNGVVEYALRVFGLQQLHHLVDQYIDKIRQAKLVNKQTGEILKLITEKISLSNFSREVERALCSAIVQACQFGIVEIIVEIKKSCLHLIMNTYDEYDRTIFHVAIVNRQPKIFNLIHEIGPQKNYLVNYVDKSKNSMLHLAAMLVPSRQFNKVHAPALLMQSELQWLKEIETVVEPKWRTAKNAYGKSPSDIFSETHKGLLKEGQKWMISMATSYVVMATVIITLMFTASFDPPGGTGEIGRPLFFHVPTFMVYAISSSVSLSSSIASVLMFLAILTSRFVENDFLEDLPRKLITGLIFLFIAISAMMVTFYAALNIMLRDCDMWITISITLLAFCPIFLYGILQLLFCIRVIRSTYFPSNISKQKSH